MARRTKIGIEESEHDIQTKILEWLNSSGHYCWRNNTGMVVAEYKGKKRMWRAGKKGSSDILGVSKMGRFIAIEVKKKGGKATIPQIEFLHDIRKRGGHAFVACSLEDVIEFFKNIY